MHSVRAALKAIAANRINLLIIFAPTSWWLSVSTPGSQWVFLTAAASLVSWKWNCCQLFIQRAT